MRWLMALVVSFAVASPAAAGVFKARGGSKPAAAPAKKPEKKAPKVDKTEKAEKTEPAEPADKPEKADKPAKAAAAPAKKAPKAAAAPAKTSKKKSAVATGRPDDLTPDAAPPTKKKGKGQDVAITVEDEDDVIIRDIDD